MVVSFATLCDYRSAIRAHDSAVEIKIRAIAALLDHH
jgi:hypothetical protein